MLCAALVTEVALAAPTLQSVAVTPAASAESALTSQLNVLFIALDDFRPEIGAYGVTDINTPNLDTLASQGMLFKRAYTQMATCSPSRTSLLTGLRPDTTKVQDLTTNFRTTIPTVVTLPQYFKSQGYASRGIGKVFHDGLNDSLSWDTGGYQDTSNHFPVPTGPDGKKLASSPIDQVDSMFADGEAADKAIAALQTLKGQKFFLAVGFKKPHLPFLAPRRYFDMYPASLMTLASNSSLPTGAPTFSTDNSGEVRTYSSIPAGPFSTSLQQSLKQGYYASASFVDAQVGRVLAELTSLGLADKTVVVVWGDHGWHLGEHGSWGKHTNFEVGTRSPLMIRVPGQTTAGTKAWALVEFVDVYPTVCALAGLPIPDNAAHGGYGMPGRSLAPLIQNASLASSTTKGSFSQWRRSGYTGHSIRTRHYRFTEWVKSGSASVYELYDHQTDDQENTNVANNASYASVRASLLTALHDGGAHPLPAGL
jgi:arylsulfatase A-like enzyme